MESQQERRCKRGWVYECGSQKAVKKLYQEETHMKKILLIGLILGVLTSYSYAQMAGQKGQMMEQKGMMNQGEMMNNMMGMTNQMSEMTGKMSNIMKGMPTGNMKNMAEIMKGMSQQMMHMSNIMGKGTASEKDMKNLQGKMMQLQNKISDLEKKK